MDYQQELLDLVKDQGTAFESFKSKVFGRIENLEAGLTDFAKKHNRPVVPGGDSTAADDGVSRWIDVKSGNPVPVVRHGQSLAAMQEKADANSSVGRVLRGICLGAQSVDAEELAEERKALSINEDPSGGYTVSGVHAGQWIDNLRAAMVLSRAGCLTLPMDAGEVSIARVTSDPVCSWHGENASLPETKPTFGTLTLRAKTITCLVKLSVELAQDSANIEQQLQTVIINAMAGAIDSAGINGVSKDAAVAPSGIMNLPGRNSVTSIGAPASWDFMIDGMYELMADNVQQGDITALVGHPALWKKLAKLKTGITNDNTPLVMPAEVAAIPKLWTTAAPLSGGTAKAMLANWRDLIMGVRQQITVRVLNQSFMGSNLQLALLAYARVDFGAAREASFCSLEGITV